METVAWRLAQALDGIVLDHTGLHGAYSYTLSQEPMVSTLPSMLETELGLSLERRTVPVEYFVIDSIEPPSSTTTARVYGPAANGQRLVLHDDKSKWILDPALFRSEFRSEPMMDMKLANVDVRIAIADIAKRQGRVVIIDPNIQGSISAEVTAVPWLQVLDDMARFKGGSMRQADGVIYIEHPGG